MSSVEFARSVIKVNYTTVHPLFLSKLISWSMQKMTLCQTATRTLSAYISKQSDQGLWAFVAHVSHQGPFHIVDIFLNNIQTIAPDMTFCFQPKIIFLLYLDVGGHSIEQHLGGNSNEYLQHTFLWWNRKKYPSYLQLCRLTR